MIDLSNPAGASKGVSGGKLPPLCAMGNFVATNAGGGINSCLSSFIDIGCINDHRLV